MYIYRLVDVGCLKPCRFDLKISSSHLQGVVHGAGALPFVAQLPSGGLGILNSCCLFNKCPIGNMFIYTYIHTCIYIYIYIHYIALHCITSHHIALHCIALHYIIYITLHTYIHYICMYISIHSYTRQNNLNICTLIICA